MSGDVHPDRALSIEEVEQAWSDGTERAKAGDYATALDAFIRCAETGHLVGASFAVGHFYERGPDGVPKDLMKAERWYRRAIAEDNSNDARFHLAKIILAQHRDGKSTVDRERSDEAVALLRELAGEGDPYALLYLGMLAFDGIAVPRSLDDAERLFSGAADQGFVVALIQLSRVAFAKGERFRAIRLRIRATARVLALFVREPNDKRLAFMHQGVGMDRKFPGWMASKHWPQF